MSEAQDPLEQVQRAASELVPQLTARLAQLGLGEIEVRQGELRVRVARASDVQAGPATQRAGAAQQTSLPPDRVGVVASGSPAHGVTSPAVGFFVYADGLGPGLGSTRGMNSATWRCWASVTTCAHRAAAPSATSSPRPARRSSTGSC